MHLRPSSVKWYCSFDTSLCQYITRALQSTLASPIWFVTKMIRNTVMSLLMWWLPPVSNTAVFDSSTNRQWPNRFWHEFRVQFEATFPTLTHPPLSLLLLQMGGLLSTLAQLVCLPLGSYKLLTLILAFLQHHLQPHKRCRWNTKQLKALLGSRTSW